MEWTPPIIGVIIAPSTNHFLEGGVLMHHTTIAVDLAKNIFEIAVSNHPGKISKRHRLSRSKFERFFAEHLPATVLFEAAVAPITGLAP